MTEESIILAGFQYQRSSPVLVSLGPVPTTTILHAKRILENLEFSISVGVDISVPQIRKTYSRHGYLYNYIVEPQIFLDYSTEKRPGICVLCVTNEKYSRRMAFAFLEELLKKTTLKKDDVRRLLEKGIGNEIVDSRRNPDFLEEINTLDEIQIIPLAEDEPSSAMSLIEPDVRIGYTRLGSQKWIWFFLLALCLMVAAMCGIGITILFYS